MKKTILICATCIIAFSNMKGQSAYISKIFDFVPAPGQFTNIIPEYENGDTKESIIKKVSDAICGDVGDMISLGGFGGYVVFGFDHTILNIAGEYDFKILGNAFAGSAEPGIIMVSYDVNGDGMPNDPWYEIAGSEYNNSQTIKNYTITYSKPASATGNIAWTSNQGTSGEIKHNIFNPQPYYPEWINETTLSFTGTKLPDNATYVNGKYVLQSFDWGYADNYPNTDERAGIKIEWAVNEDGTPANLPGINFVKVYSGENQSNGDIGETSTEVTGAIDLHPKASVNNIGSDNEDKLQLLESFVTSSISIINNGEDCNAYIYSTTGQLMNHLNIYNGINEYNISNLNSGLYFLKVNNKTIKFIKQ